MYCLHLPGYELIHGLITLTIKAVCFFKAARRISPVSWLRNP